MSSAASPTDESTNQMEKTGWILFWLCFVPVFGGLLSIAVMVIGVILMTRNRMNPGLLFLILGPIANTIVTVLFVLIFFAGVFGLVGASGQQNFNFQFDTRTALPSPTPVR